jgi:hypothetical protein
MLRYYHAKYNIKVLRTAPNSVSISDPAAIHSICIAGSRLPKDSKYMNFNLGPVVSIFSAINTKYRDARSKVIALLFATVRFRNTSEQPHGIITGCIADFIRYLQAFKTAALERKSGPVKADILDLSARLSIDIVTGYLLNKPYGGFRKFDSLSIKTHQKTKLSANPFIFAIVAFACFSLLLHKLFVLVYSISSKLYANIKVSKSTALVDDFADKVVKTTIVLSSYKGGTIEDSYQGRLLAAGVEPSEVTAQSKAIVFAGANSVAVILSIILFYLVQKKDVRARLLHEIRNRGTAPDQRTPYLHIVAKKELQLVIANLIRFTRVVQDVGFELGSGSATIPEALTWYRFWMVLVRYYKYRYISMKN